MIFQIRFQPRANREFREASNWYRDKSEQAAINFFAAVNDSVDIILKQPDRFRKTYKNFRETLVKKYPYTIVYIFDHENNMIIISSIFHQKRGPKTKYRNLS